MKKLSFERLAETVKVRRKAAGMTQMELAGKTGINRSMIGQIENRTFKPSIEQLEILAETLDFEVTDLYVDEEKAAPKAQVKACKIAVAGTGYVGLSIATLLPSTTTSPPWTSSRRRSISSITASLPFRTSTSKNILPKRNWT